MNLGCLAGRVACRPGRNPTAWRLSDLAHARPERAEPVHLGLKLRGDEIELPAVPPGGPARHLLEAERASEAGCSASTVMLSMRLIVDLDPTHSTHGLSRGFRAFARDCDGKSPAPPSTPGPAGPAPHVASGLA
jgi:hypothetical protein